MCGDVVYRGYGVHYTRPEDVSFGTFATREEAEEETAGLLERESPAARARQSPLGLTVTTRCTSRCAGRSDPAAARTRSTAEKEGVSLDLQKEYNWLLARGIVTNDEHRKQPISDASYYYNIGLLLFEKGKPQKARK